MTDAVPPSPDSSPRPSLALRVATDPLGLVSSIVIVVVILGGVLAPWIMPNDPAVQNLSLVNAPPLGEYLLGGDRLGRDIFSRLLSGTQQTVIASLIVVVVASVLGITSGLVAGYRGGRVDAVAGWLSDLLMSLPGMILIIALYSVVGGSIYVSMAFFGILIAPSYFRLVRSLVLGIRNELYIDAARVFGVSEWRIVSRHVLGAIRGPIIMTTMFILAAGIAIQAGLEYLGLGDPNSSSWGRTLQETFENITMSPIAALWPSLLITITTLALVLLGTVLRDAVQSAGSRPDGLSARVKKRIVLARRSSLPQRVSEPPSASQVLSVTDLAIGYPDSPTTVAAVVHGVSLAINRGEVLGVVGESGSGKSQIVAAILGILPRTAVVLSGSVLYGGRDLMNDEKGRRAALGRHIGYVPQEPMANLDPTYTVGKQLEFALRATRRLPRKQALEQIYDLLRQVGIESPAAVCSMYPHQVSGGTAQRILIAGALIGDPELLIADEPTTALDVTVQAEVLELLRTLRSERNLSILLVTHNLGVVADICDSVAVMRRGVLVETGSVQELLSAPKHEYTQSLLRAVPDRETTRTPLPELTLPEGRP